MPPFIYNKENGEMKEVYCSTKLSALFDTEDDLISRTHSAGNWYWNQGDISIYVQDYALGLLTLGGSAYDKVQMQIPRFVDMLKKMPVVTDNNIHELVYMIANMSVSSFLFDKCLGFITNGLIIQYLNIVTHIMETKPKSICIGRWFFTGIHHLSNNIAQHNDMVMNAETIKH